MAEDLARDQVRKILIEDMVRRENRSKEDPLVPFMADLLLDRLATEIAAEITPELRDAMEQRAHKERESERRRAVTLLLIQGLALAFVVSLLGNEGTYMIEEYLKASTSFGTGSQLMLTLILLLTVVLVAYFSHAIDILNYSLDAIQQRLPAKKASTDNKDR